VCQIAHPTALAAAPVIEREAPGDANQPGAKTIAIAKLAESLVRAHARVLRHVLRILAVPEHRVGDAEREPRALGEPSLEFALERVVHGYDCSGQEVRALLHTVTFCPSSKTPRPPARFSTNRVDPVSLNWRLSCLP
jgi:hypothetical protein